ncbi:hypothetical protein [Intestinimonas massiliensis (ex Afouda et al. 2020)]|uniref:hypothetical protein n=1 Tax=Intestinimonas massiliensis (ex Afouda et al. 2020) TaxID=1673721 RepID=UPI001030B00D|nr:hypothetical protein [Intestinimonas massiliensis (ex Afouda et al. 2020)]
MEYKLLDAPAAFAEIARMEAAGEEGVVVNIAERLWAGCAPDDAYREEVRKAHDILIFHSGYRPGMVDLVFPGDLCICVMERRHSFPGDGILKAAQQHLNRRGISAVAYGSDFLVRGDDGNVYKAGSYGIVRAGELWETTVHISIHADMELLRKFRQEQTEMERIGLRVYGVAAEDVLNDILGADNTLGEL